MTVVQRGCEPCKKYGCLCERIGPEPVTKMLGQVFFPSKDCPRHGWMA